MTPPELAMRGHVTRNADAIIADLEHACRWLGTLAEQGIGPQDVPAIGRTAEGIRRLVAEAGAGGGR